MENQGAGEFKKPEVNIIVEIIEYVPNAVIKKTVMNKTSSNITMSSFVVGEGLGERIFPMDIFLQVIEGTTQVIIHGKIYELRLGEGIVIPANVGHVLYSAGKFKMISTGIKHVND